MDIMGLLTQEPAITVREARESKSNKNRIEKILKKWTSLASDLSNATDMHKASPYVSTGIFALRLLRRKCHS